MEPMRDDAVTDSDDAMLLARYAAGDAAAARRLTARLVPRVFAHAARLLGDPAEAEDVAQEAMLRLWRAAPDWRRDGGKVTTWLYRVTANLCTDRLRRRRSVALDAAPEPHDPAPSAAAGLQRAARAEALQAALMALPDRQREAVVLHHLEDLPIAEIAQIMDTGPQAVESLLARGRRALAARLAARRAELGYTDDER